MLEQTVRKLGRNFNEAWTRTQNLVTQADELEIERALRTLQLIKGKTYARALLKENGKVINEIGFDIGIGLMLRKHQISREELDRWYDNAEKTKFEGHIFQPLPDKSDAWRLFMDVRKALFQLRRAAEDLIDQQKQQLLPADTRLSREGLIASLELGMWRLLSPEQKDESFALLTWDELPKEARLDFFNSLPMDEKSSIYSLPDPKERELATKKRFCKIWNKAAPALNPSLAL